MAQLSVLVSKSMVRAKGIPVGVSVLVLVRGRQDENALELVSVCAQYCVLVNFNSEVKFGDAGIQIVQLDVRSAI